MQENVKFEYIVRFDGICTRMCDDCSRFMRRRCVDPDRFKLYQTNRQNGRKDAVLVAEDRRPEVIGGQLGRLTNGGQLDLGRIGFEGVEEIKSSDKEFETEVLGRIAIGFLGIRGRRF